MSCGFSGLGLKVHGLGKGFKVSGLSSTGEEFCS